jgi:hypothetical protein
LIARGISERLKEKHVVVSGTFPRCCFDALAANIDTPQLVVFVEIDEADRTRLNAKKSTPESLTPYIFPSGIEPDIRLRPKVVG